MALPTTKPETSTELKGRETSSFAARPSHHAPATQVIAAGAILPVFAQSPKVADHGYSAKMKILEPGRPSLPQKPSSKAICSSGSVLKSANPDASPGMPTGSDPSMSKPLALKFAGGGRGSKGPTQKLKEFESLMMNGLK